MQSRSAARLETKAGRHTSADDARAASTYRPDIDGLRAVAVIAVVLYHAGFSAISGGFVGVDAFFVISGFLITGLLWRELAATRRISLRTFYARRARRLLPASVLVIVVTVLASAQWLSPLQSESVGDDGLASAAYVLNHRLAAADTSYLDVAQPSPLQHYWSLAVEEQFYVVWPALVILVSLAWRKRQVSMRAATAGLAVVGVASLAACVWLTERSQPWAFFSLPTRAWEFVVGALVALGVGRLRVIGRGASSTLAVAGLVLLVGASVAFDAHTTFPGLAALAPVLGTATIIAAGSATDAGAVTRALAVTPMRAIGRVSYSWYLWHWPALVIVPAIAGRELTSLENLGVVTGALGVAVLTTRLIEDPIRFSPRLMPRLGLTFAMAAVLTLAAAAVSLVVPGSDPALAGGDAAAAPPTLGGAAPAAPVAPTSAATTPAPAGPDATSTPPSASQGAGTEPSAAEPAATADTSSAEPTTTVATAGTSGVEPTTTAATTTTPAPATTLDPVVVTLMETSAAVSAQISAAATVTDVPENLTPSLREAHGNKATPFADGCFSGFRDAEVRECVYGASPGSSTIVLFGDSHASAWFPALEAVALARDQRLVVLSKATCPPLAAPVYSPDVGRDYRECDEWRPKALQRIAAERPAIVVFAMNRAYGDKYGLPFYGEEWLRGLGEMVTSVEALGSRVAVLGAVPLPVHDVPDCLSEHLSEATACAANATDQFQIDGAVAERRVVEAAGGAFIDVRPWFCDSSACAVIVGNLLVYRDQNHITTDFASWISPVVGASLDVAARS